MVIKEKRCRMMCIVITPSGCRGLFKSSIGSLCFNIWACLRTSIWHHTSFFSQSTQKLRFTMDGSDTVFKTWNVIKCNFLMFFFFFFFCIPWSAYHSLSFKWNSFFFHHKSLFFPGATFISYFPHFLYILDIF